MGFFYLILLYRTFRKFMSLRAADLVLRRRGNLFLPEIFHTMGDCFALSGSQRHLFGENSIQLATTSLLYLKVEIPYDKMASCHTVLSKLETCHKTNCHKQQKSWQDF